jgi:hypothetical protein
MGSAMSPDRLESGDGGGRCDHQRREAASPRRTVCGGARAELEQVFLSSRIKGVPVSIPACCAISAVYRNFLIAIRVVASRAGIVLREHFLRRPDVL